jgi:hypothetical protein
MIRSRGAYRIPALGRLARAGTLALLLSLGLGLSGCVTPAPNRLSALETAELRFASLDVRVPETAPIVWGAAEEDYARAHGLAPNDPAVAATPAGRAFVRDLTARRLRAKLELVTAKRPPGTRPVRLVATVTRVDIPSAIRRITIGGNPVVSLEAQKVMELRLVRIAWGGADARSEMMSMVGEKVVAAMEAANTVMAGGSHDQVLARYRELVADNTRRLMGA